MTLREKQSLFVSLIAELLPYILNHVGYELTFGETYRSPEEAARLAKLRVGIKNSNHIRKLAMDLNLFLNGKYLTTVKSYEHFGEYWESLHPLCRWGGRFGDPYHFSLEHNGVK